MMDLPRAPAGLIPDFRELVVQTVPMAAAHKSANRPPPDKWGKVYAVVEKLALGDPQWFGTIDDLLVIGCRFRAVPNVLRRRFPTVRITGLFIARRVSEAINLSALFGDPDV
jgi:hypothetical protein